MAEETPHDSEVMRCTTGTELDNGCIPNVTTTLNVRHLSEEHKLTEAIFAELNTHLTDKGVTRPSGAVVDAAIIDAPSSTNNKAKARDPEMSFKKKGNDRSFGIMAHIGVDAESGVTHSLDMSTAKVHGGHIWDQLLQSGGTSVWTDKGYVSAEREAGFTGPGKVRGACARPARGLRCILSTNGSTASSPWCAPRPSIRSASLSASSAMRRPATGD